VAQLQAARPRVAEARAARAARPWVAERSLPARAPGELVPKVRRQAWPDGLVQPAVRTVMPLVPRASRGARDGSAAPPVVPSPDATGGER